jgi:hypothetical protein
VGRGQATAYGAFHRHGPAGPGPRARARDVRPRRPGAGSLPLDPAATLTTTGGTGDGAVSYSVGTSNGCAVNNVDQLTVTNASGTCTVTATKAGNTNYESTTSAAKSARL